MQSSTEKIEKSIRETYTDPKDRGLVKWANLMERVRKIGYGDVTIIVRDGLLVRIERTLIQDNCDNGV